MSNPSGPDEAAAAAETTANPAVPGDLPTAERRFTAPSTFAAGETEVMGAVQEPATEVMPVTQAPPTAAALRPNTQAFPEQTNAAPQAIPPKAGAAKPKRRKSNWGWIIAVLLVIAALAALAVLGTVVLSKKDEPTVSQEDAVRTTIQNFDTSIQKGDLATLRTITCGGTADNYVKYDATQWKDIHAKIATARQYPVIASIDQVVVHSNNHAEANVTTFMAFDPSTRSTRSLDLEFRDDKWKICQAPN